MNKPIDFKKAKQIYDPLKRKPEVNTTKEFTDINPEEVYRILANNSNVRNHKRFL